MTESPPTDGTMERDAAWLALQQRLVAHAAHDVRNALNGLAVNVEVVRARATRGAAGDQIAPFATNAADQLEGAMRQVEALLALARPARAVDAAAVADALRALEPLLTGGCRIAIAQDDAGPVPAVEGDTLRLVLAAAVVAIVDGDAGSSGGDAFSSGGDAASRSIAVALGVDQDGRTRVNMRGKAPAALPPAVLRVAADAGVLVTLTPDGIALTIPASETR